MSDVDLDIEFAPWEGVRVPVTLIGGYLGAGKTTVINALLERTDQPIAVLVNDVGEINIDSRLIARKHGDTVELTDGCICCSLAGGLAEAFAELRERPTPPAHLVIELSGVADPRRVLPWADSIGFRRDGVIVLIDPTNIAERLDDPVIRPHLLAQIEPADLLVLSKADIATDEQLGDARRRLAELAPETAVVDATAALAAGLLDTGTRRGPVTATAPPTLFDVHETTTVELPRPISEVDLRDRLEALPANVVRAKGVAEAPDGGRLLIQMVGRSIAIDPLPDAESEPPTDLVVISVNG